MLFAVDKNNQRVHISEAVREGEYFCPSCDEKLVLKMGQIVAHHFSHPKNSLCGDNWNYDMSEWHINWQSRFPKKMQEVVKTYNGQRHRADVLIEEAKTVIEFQHSPMSIDEFEDRNWFYNRLGYHVIWVFDVHDKFQSDAIEEHGRMSEYKFHWKRAQSTFASFNAKGKDVTLFLQFLNSDDNNAIYIDEDGEETVLENEDGSIPYLTKVTWNAPGGLKYFAIEDNYYGIDDFMDLFRPYFINTEKNLPKKKTKKKINPIDLKDYLFFLLSKDHTQYFYGCPLSKSHISASSTIDVPKAEYDVVRPCAYCEYYDYDEKIGPCCKQRFINFTLPDGASIKEVKRDEYGTIEEIIIANLGEEEKHTYPTYPNVGRSVLEIWEKKKIKKGIFRNLKTNTYIKIIRNPIESQKKHQKIYGYFSHNQYSFNGEMRELYGVTKPEWLLIWYQKK